MSDEPAQCILRNQIEIMGALSLLLRYAAPNLIGKAGELDGQRDDLLQRHKSTQRVLAGSNGGFPAGATGVGMGGGANESKTPSTVTNGERREV